MLGDQGDHQEHVSSKKEDREIPHWVGRWLTVMSHDQSSLTPYATNCSRHPARPEGRAGGESPLQTSEVLAACSCWLPGSGKDWCSAGGLLFPRSTFYSVRRFNDRREYAEEEEESDTEYQVQGVPS